MRELFPEDPTLTQFAHRFSTPLFNPISFHPILSPSQTRPKASIVVEEASSRQDSPAPRFTGATTTNSPKRPLDELEDDTNRPRKFIRAESPLKGAAGRRLDQQKRTVNGGGLSVQGTNKPQAPAPLPREIMFLLSIIPNASSYDASRFSPEKMVSLIRQIDVPQNISQLRLPAVHGGGMNPVTMSGAQYMGKSKL